MVILIIGFFVRKHRVMHHKIVETECEGGDENTTQHLHTHEQFGLREAMHLNEVLEDMNDHDTKDAHPHLDLLLGRSQTVLQPLGATIDVLVVEGTDEDRIPTLNCHHDELRDHHHINEFEDEQHQYVLFSVVGLELSNHSQHFMKEVRDIQS